MKNAFSSALCAAVLFGTARKKSRARSNFEVRK